MLSRQLRIDAFGKRVRVTEICPGRVATDIFAHVHGDSEDTYERFIEGFELPEAEDIADAIAFAIAAPVAVNIGHMEITPTLQVPGGLSTTRPERPRRPERAAHRPLSDGMKDFDLSRDPAEPRVRPHAAARRGDDPRRSRVGSWLLAMALGDACCWWSGSRRAASRERAVAPMSPTTATCRRWCS